MPSKKKRPFTQEELAEAMAELDEEAFEWVAYCTYCGAAVEVSSGRRIVETVALMHASRSPNHQVVVGREILGRSYAVGAEP